MMVNISMSLFDPCISYGSLVLMSNFLILSFLIFIVMVLWFSINIFVLFSSSLSYMIFFSYLVESMKTFFNKGIMMFFMYILVVYVNVIFMMNFIGTIPLIFAISSLFSVVIFLSLSAWIMIFIEGVRKIPKMFISHFYMEGMSLILIYFICLIETLGWFLRFITLTLRLSINIFAGHMIIMVFEFLLIEFYQLNFFFFFLLCSFFFFYEFMVSLIQSYVYVMLLCSYFSEVDYFEEM